MKKYKLKKICVAMENAGGAGAPPEVKEKRMKKIESHLAMMESAVTVEPDDEGDLFEDYDEEPFNHNNKALVCQAPKKRRKKVGFPASL